MRALNNIEKMLKIRVMKMDLDDLSLEQLSVILWAGLAHEDKDLTPEKVMDLVDDFSSLTDVTQVMSDAFQESFKTKNEPGKI